MSNIAQPTPTSNVEGIQPTPASVSEPIEIKLSSIPVLPPPPLQPTVTPNIKTKKNITERKNSVVLSNEDLIKVSIAIDKLHDIEESDKALQLKAFDDARRAEIEKLKAERKILESTLKTTLFGPLCLALGPTVIMDLHDKIALPEAKDKLCSNPDEFVLYVLSSIVDLLVDRLKKIVSMTTGLFMRGVSPIISKTGNLVKQNNLTRKANTAAKNGASSKVSGLAFIQSIKKALPLLTLPLKAIFAPHMQVIKLSCTELHLHEILAKFLKEVDKTYITICLVKNPKELAIYLTSTLVNNAYKAGEALKSGIIKGKQLVSNVSHKTYNLARTTFTRNTASRVGEGIKSGFVSAGQGIKSGFVSAGEGIRNTAKKTQNGIISSGQVFSNTTRQIGNSITSKVVPSLQTPALEKTSGFFSRLFGRGGRRRTKKRAYRKKTCRRN